MNYNGPENVPKTAPIKRDFAWHWPRNSCISVYISINSIGMKKNMPVSNTTCPDAAAGRIICWLVRTFLAPARPAISRDFSALQMEVSQIINDPLPWKSVMAMAPLQERIQGFHRVGAASRGGIFPPTWWHYDFRGRLGNFRGRHFMTKAGMSLTSEGGTMPTEGDMTWGININSDNYYQWP